MIKQKLKKLLNQKTESSTLAFFRMGFGLIMCYSIIRFWNKGWIELLYLDPNFHFSYYGFDWIKPIGQYTYLIFIACFISSLFVMVGYKYRISIITFFLSFTYIELMDKTTYLNHYYFISIISFIMILLPAHVNFSLDSIINKKHYKYVSSWTVNSLKLLIVIVYIYAGLAKINADWLLEAMPLKLWLTSKYDLPIIGNTLMQKSWVHYGMSWGGMLYDLSIPFLLIYQRTRVLAFFLVIFFHVFTMVLFPIGMFPHIMIFSSMIFFSSKFHNKIIEYIRFIFSKIIPFINNYNTTENKYFEVFKEKLVVGTLSVFFVIQLTFPFRHNLYPGELFWHEQGYRFSWRVMLIEKIGYTNFRIFDPISKSSFMIDSSEHLSPLQLKQMSFQPDFILEFAHYLGDKYSTKNKKVEVYADSYVALNGRDSQKFIDPNVNLYLEKESFKNKTWILPLNDEIKDI